MAGCVGFGVALFLTVRSWNLSICETLGWGCGRLVIQHIVGGKPLDLSQSFPKNEPCKIPNGNFVVVELGRSAMRTPGNDWIHMVGRLPCHGLLAVTLGAVSNVVLQSVASYIFDNETDCFGEKKNDFCFVLFLRKKKTFQDNLRVDVRWSFDPSAHLLHGEPILPSAFHVVFAIDRFQKADKALILSKLEFPSFLLVSCGSADIGYELMDASVLTARSVSDGKILFSGIMNEGDVSSMDAPPKWLIEAAGRSELRAANYHHPFLRFAGEFKWRSLETFGSNWSAALLIAPSCVYGKIGLIDSMFQQCVFTLPSRQQYRFCSIRRFVVAPGAFKLAKYMVYVRLAKEVDMWLCDSETGVVLMKVEGVEASAVEVADAKSNVTVAESVYELGWEASVDKEEKTARFSPPLLVACTEKTVKLVATAFPQGVKPYLIGKDDSVDVPAEFITVNAIGLEPCLSHRHLQMCHLLFEMVHREALCWLYTVVANCHSVMGEPIKRNPWARAIWEMGRCLTVERGEILLHTMVDIESVHDIASATLSDVQTSTEQAYRNGLKYLAHLSPVSAEDWPPRGNYALSFLSRGKIQNLQFVEVPPMRASSVDSIQLNVEYSALNLRDVLDVLGLYPGDAGLMGLEFAGRAVEDGTRMFGLSGGSFGSSGFSNTVVTRKEFVAEIPDSLSTRDAATMPFAFCNAMAAFEVCFGSPGVVKDLTLLITSMHVCYGGAGVALAQLAHLYGAKRIFAIAGESSQKYIKSWNVDHVMPYGQMSYAEQVLMHTGGRGVDATINSVIGLDYATRSMQVLAEEGKWLELGPLLTKTQVFFFFFMK